MHLTPIRIRGKRRTPPTKPPLALGGETHDHNITRRSLSSVMAARQTRYRASLDALPSEILETILLYSANLSLPHASPIIGLRLSERVTRLRFFIWAFHETWDQYFGTATLNEPLQEPAAPATIDCRGDHRLQTSLLRQPWATIDFILQAQQTWADRHAHDRPYHHSVPWEDDTIDPPHPSTHTNDGPPPFNAHTCFRIDYQQALKWDPFRLESTPWGTRDIHPQTRIPDSLLTGPWTEEAQKLLFFFSRGGLVLHADLIPWEMKLEFLRNAILDVTHPNIMAVNCLLGTWVFHHLPRDVVRRELANISRRLEWGDDTDMTRYILRRIRSAFEMLL